MNTPTPKEFLKEELAAGIVPLNSATEVRMTFGELVELVAKYIEIDRAAERSRLLEEAGMPTLDEWNTKHTELHLKHNGAAYATDKALFEWMRSRCAALLLKEREKAENLQAFKDYVHQRLDEADVPTHPEGEHSKEGCRIGDRLDIALSPEKTLRFAEWTQDEEYHRIHDEDEVYWYPTSGPDAQIDYDSPLTTAQLYDIFDSQRKKGDSERKVGGSEI